MKIIKAQQPDIHKRLRQQNRKQNKKKSGRGKQEHLSFSDVMELMKHDSYKRHRGAIRQR
ncbi:hypothetical protein phiCT19406C_30 (endogenous virus) [Clostridium phage phiCT19406C]|uniref:hypothetical protein n=1 Tax=Clostridium phage phiCT19406C TaxID=1567011 RepID=UPI000572A9E8|nr:hypothetical protein phiCT19406C_30 [Clostridium phage phiCT19406C]AJA42853.1 hypothetical protein phiCT19406C_30 [Clostridium phage phiCT19406C]